MKVFDNKDIILSCEGISKIFKNDRGVFNIDFKVREGEIFGIIGESGAGKSTILRLLMGFLKPTDGYSLICGLDCYKEAMDVKEYVSYVPGEFNLFDLRSGVDFLEYISELDELDGSLANDLIQRFQLDVKAYPKRMSKGMKQKMALVTAFMKDVPLYLLDEPSIGLDPLMREELMNLIQEFNSKKKTFVITTNDYEEVKRLCDRVLIISKGHYIDVIDVKEIINSPKTLFTLELINNNDIEKLKEFNVNEEDGVVKVTIQSNELGKFFKIMSDVEINKFNIKTFSLEDVVTEKMEQSEYGKKEVI